MKKNYVTLGELATYVNGYAFKPTDWSDEGLEIIRIQNLTGNLSEVNLYSGEYNKKYEVNNGDVLISWSASLGVYVWNKGRAILNQHIFKVVFNKVDVDKEFFIQQVGYILGRANVHAHGATMKHLTRPVFDSLKFYFPSREEQKDISNKLCIVDRLIELHEKYVKDLEQLVKSRFMEMFGDRNFSEVKAADICDFITKGTTPNANDIYEDFSEGRIPYIKVYNLSNNGQMLFDERPQFIGTGVHEGLLKRSKVYPGDVLMNIVGPPLGKFAIVPKEYGEWNINQAIAIFRPKEKIRPIYLLYALMQPDILKPFLHRAVGIRQLNLSLEQCRELIIKLPPIDLQNQFADFVEQVNKSKFTHCYELLLLIIKKIWYNNYV